MWFARLIGIVPLGIGLTVLGFLWLTPFDEFGSPPLFFRIFGSFVALGFVLFGVGIIAASFGLRGMRLPRPGDADVPPAVSLPGDAGYQCAHCGATLGEKADVSPHGDVKCAHCGRWFNIHRR
jgi:DNA-directed RNA polymerase subunit RPC12/RpoP